jgi:hypothetical protein
MSLCNNSVELRHCIRSWRRSSAMQHSTETQHTARYRHCRIDCAINSLSCVLSRKSPEPNHVCNLMGDTCMDRNRRSRPWVSSTKAVLHSFLLIRQVTLKLHALVVRSALSAPWIPFEPIAPHVESRRSPEGVQLILTYPQDLCHIHFIFCVRSSLSTRDWVSCGSGFDSTCMAKKNPPSVQPTRSISSRACAKQA